MWDNAGLLYKWKRSHSKETAGHKRNENTMKHISMIHFKDHEFEVATATTVDEAKQVISSGFEYITEKRGIMLSKRPKRLSAFVWCSV